MPRAIWSGAISFGLVNIPVKLYSAVSPKGLAFHQLHDKDGVRIRMKRICPSDGEEVAYENIVKGFEVARDRYVIVTDEELEKFAAQATHTVDIQTFVDLDEIDPIYYDSTYYVAPDRGAGKPYRLLFEAMQRTGKVAVARVVLRTKEYLAALRPMGHALALSTMHFQDEVVSQDDLPALPDDKTHVAPRELEMAEQLVTSLSSEFDPEKFKDEHRERLLAFLEKKAEGEHVVMQPSVPERAQVVDLVSALRASLEAAKKNTVPHPTLEQKEPVVEEGEEAAEKPRRHAASSRSKSATSTRKPRRHSA